MTDNLVAGEPAARATLRPCPACGGGHGRPLHRVRLRPPDGHPLGDGYVLVTCDRCGAGFADAAVRPADYQRWYARHAKYAGEAAAAHGPAGVAAGGDAGAETTWTAARVEATAARLARLLPPGARVLDVGCATGALLAALRRRGAGEVVGVDPSPRAAEVAARVHRVRVEVGSFGALPPGLGRFDAVCATGVLEHLWDTEEAMLAVRGLLRPGGLLYLEVPDAARYDQPLLVPFQDFSTEHVNHFSAATLDTLVARHGGKALWRGPADAEQAEGVPVAVLAGAWRLDAPPAQQPPPRPDKALRVRPDRALRGRLAAYARGSAALLARVDAHLRAQLAGAPAVYVWGAGELLATLLAGTVLGELPLAGLADGNPARHGLRFGGVPVGPPGALHDPDLPVVVASVLSDGPIRAAAARLGLPNRLVGVAPAPASMTR